ncbi:hypothetical protein [Desulfobacter sp.]
MAIFNSILVFTCIISLANTAFSATFCVSDAVELQDALTTSASNGEDDVVQIEQGTYVGNFVYASTEDYGITIEGGYTSDFESRNVNSANTVIDGDGAGTVLVLSAPDTTGTTEFSIECVTIQNGSTTDNGGGIYANISNITLTNNTISGNTVEGWYGGGIYASVDV